MSCYLYNFESISFQIGVLIKKIKKKKRFQVGFYFISGSQKLEEL